MSDSLAEILIATILAAPLLASVVIAAFGKRLLREASAWPCVAALAISFVASIAFVLAPSEHGATAVAWKWIDVGTLDVPVAFRVDAMTAVMLSTVTFVSTLVAIFSSAYMHGDRGYARYFAAVSLFVFSMCLLVLADNLLVLFAGWEGVGLCSYLLIGFWYEKPAAAAAARKAFVVNRIGDLAMLIGLFLIWTSFGTLDLPTILSAEAIQRVAAETYGPLDGHAILVTICLLLFGGAIGKSAQFPLMVWLPDAMEGPTPVSALIHAATMVTAGVYLVARCTPLFLMAPEAQTVVGLTGGLTAILAALIALTQNDLKKVLAYSTVSQLGYMFLALGAAVAGEAAATAAVVAAMFHLVTHAFFKALLFLGAGSVMHAMNGEIDVRGFGGLRRQLPWTHATFLAGIAALAGAPLLAGFWSKDEILAALKTASSEGSFASYFFALFVLAIVTAALTAFYSFRVYFLTFWGEARYSHDHVHPHESPPAMTGPLVALAVLAALAGLILGPTGMFNHFLAHTPGLPEAHEHHFDWTVALLGTLATLAGIAFAYVAYVASPDLPRKLAAISGPLYTLSLRKFYLDEIYGALIVLPLLFAGRLFSALDRSAVDPTIDRVAGAPRAIGAFLRPNQNGRSGWYALAMFAGVAVLMVAAFASLFRQRVEARVPVEATPVSDRADLQGGSR
ncbi:MAG TPA: NADH-quinone oxidoreductase subunit L [Pirellulaceae bacterium]|jgi:NADH-quinone oxidoreductase subunit L|nr:NADH-quinone oxidoreductase subunit L [Pirellulaceae bacterium]